MILLVVRNLLSNAIKFTKPGGTIKIDIEPNNSFSEIKITDNGIGIETDDIKKILSENEFYTTASIEYEKGNGLGIKLCKNFI